MESPKSTYSPTQLNPPTTVKKTIHQSGQSSHEGKLRVLVVEDDKINRNILCKRLKMDGHEVLESTNGQEAVEMIESDRKFDIILMDIQYALCFSFIKYLLVSLLSLVITILLSPSFGTKQMEKNTYGI